MTLAGIKITKIDGGKIKFDEIVGFTSDPVMTTISYTIKGKQRTLSIESEAVEIECNV